MNGCKCFRLHQVDQLFFQHALDAVSRLREENPEIIDQDLPPVVVAGEKGEAVGRIQDGDSVVFFNFRGDRSIEISRSDSSSGIRYSRKLPA